MRLLLQLVLILLPLTVTAQPKVGYQKGQQVDSPLVVQYGFRDGRRTDIPLPPGRWVFRHLGPISSTGNITGVNLWLEQAVSGKVSQFLTFREFRE